MSFPQGIAFRATAGYVTDGANDYGETAGGNNYPTTSTQGNNVGFESGNGGNTRDRNAGNDPRLAGCNFISAAIATYRIDLPATGNYKARIAMGEAASYGSPVKCEIFDTTSSLGVLASTSTSGSQRFRDAVDTEYTNVTWPGSNALSASKTFASTICRFKMGDGLGSSFAFAYVYIEAAGGGGSTGTVAKTNANDTSAASGTTTILGTLAKTNANDTLSASGTTTVTGTLAKTNANDSVVASGTTTVTGTLAKTNANDTIVASGAAGNITGTLAYTNNNDTVVASGATPSSAIFGRSGLGGDDVPRRKSPHKGWNKAEWKKRVKDDLDSIETTLRQTYAELTQETVPAVVVAKAEVIVKPIVRGIEPPRIDWEKLAKDYARANALVKLHRDEMELRAAIEEEDELLMAAL